MNRRKTRSSLAVFTVLGLLIALLPLAGVSAATPEIVAYDMVGSSSLNLVSYTNPFTGAFSSAGDGFQKYQRNVSSSIPFAVLDDSLSIFPPDSIGVVKEGNVDEFFGMVDTQNGDNSGPVSATWVFDVTGLSDLSLSIDMGAMGDFESSDWFEWSYSFDGGSSAVALASTVDEAGSYTYTLEGGASFTLNDPMLVDGTILTDDLATFTAQLDGSGSSLAVTLTAVTNGGSEGYAFQNLVISGAKAIVLDCGDDVVIDAGTGITVPVSAFDLDDVASLDAVTADPSPVAGSISLTNIVPATTAGDTATADLVVSPDVPAGLYEVTVSASNGAGESATCSFMLNVVGLIPIHDVQGPGSASPLDGAVVIIEGVVVGDFQGTATDDQFSGFHLQEQDGEVDGDPMTSEGIFVFAPGAPDVAIGDVVTVRGTVDEFFGLTEITDVESVVVGGTGVASAAVVGLPVTADSDWEKYEGMLVTFPDGLYITEFFNFDRFGEVVLATSRQYQGTQIYAPGSPEAAALTAENALARIRLDDGQSAQNPVFTRHPAGGEFTLDYRFRGGDIIQNLTGVVDYAFGNYKIQPTTNAQYIVENPRAPVEDVGGTVKVAAFNVLNLFTHIDDGSNDICGPLATSECRGADNLVELQRQLDKIVAGIIGTGADVVGLQEIENDVRDFTEPVYPNRAHDPVLTLVEALNAVEGAGTWAWAGPATYYNNYPVTNEIIYKPASVSPIGDPIGYQDLAFDAVRPGSTDPVGRAPLAQTFADNNGEIFTVVANHFKSKGSACDEVVHPDTGALLWTDPGLGDGQANCPLTRVAQSEALLAFVASLQASTGDNDVLIVGDLNSYAKETPISTLEAAGYINLLAAFDGPGEYTYVFDGQLGNLDYALASSSILSQVTGTTAWHINSDEPDILDYDTSFKKDPQDALYEPNEWRASDHDPVIVGLDLNGGADFEVIVDPDSLWPPNHKYREVTVTGSDADGDLWIEIVNVVSSEMDCCYDDDDLPNDIVITGPYTADLRAERYTEVDGRVYTLTVYATDGDGQARIASVYVRVPHDQRDKKIKD